MPAASPVVVPANLGPEFLIGTVTTNKITLDKALLQAPSSGTAKPTAAPVLGASPFYVKTPDQTLFRWNGAGWDGLSVETPTALTSTYLAGTIDTALYRSAIYDGSDWLPKVITAQTAGLQAAINADTAGGMFIKSTFDATMYWERQERIVQVNFFRGAGTDTQMLQAFFNMVALIPKLWYDFTADILINANVILSGVSPSNRIKDLHITGYLRLTATAAMKNPLSIANIERGNIGSIEIVGTGGPTYSTRTVGHGVILTAVTYVNFAPSSGSYLKGSVWFDDGAGVVNNANTFEKISSYSCGSGSETAYDAAYSLTANYSARVDAGGGSPTQTTTFTMTALPGTEWDFTVARTIPLYVSFDFDYNEMYQIQSFNRGAGTITVSPQPPASAITGAARYRLGGAVTTSGSDSNINVYSHVSCVGSGIGFNIGSLYGSMCLHLDCNATAIGLAFGQSINAACLKINFPSVYCEANCLVNILKGTIAVAPSLTGVIDLGVGDVNKIKTLGYYRSAGVTYYRYVSMQGIVLTNEGRVLTFQTWPNNEAETFGQYASVLFLDLKDNNSPQIFRDTSGLNTPYITVLLPKAGINANFGNDSATITAIGAPGSFRLAPTGVVFQPPAGWKINGGTINVNATFSNFAGPAVFAVRFEFATLNLVIALETPSKDTGWAAITGTASKATIATSTCTTAQLASRVMALEAMMVAAGIKDA